MESVHFSMLRAHEALLDRADDRDFSIPRPGRRFAVVVVVFAAVGSVMALNPAGAYVTTGKGVMEGTDKVNMMVGKGAPEQIVAHGGDDVVMGNGGDDVLHGGRGADHLDGGAGNDMLHAGAGPHRDVLVGGPGDDQLYANSNDGVSDFLMCGPGEDVAYVVAINGKMSDRTVDCERIVVTDMRMSKRTKAKAKARRAR